MSKTRKRRVKKVRPHQTMKSGGSGGRSINWTRILLIVIGVMISVAMILQLVASSF